MLEPFPAAAIGTDLNATVVRRRHRPGGDSRPTAPCIVATGGGGREAAGRGAAGHEGHGPADPSRRVELGRLGASAAGRSSSEGGKPLFATGENFDADRPRDPAAARGGRPARGRAGDPRGGRRRPARLQRRDDRATSSRRRWPGSARSRPPASSTAGTSPPPSTGEVVEPARARPAQVPVKEALLVQYAGVYAPPPSVTLVGKGNAAAGVQARLPRHPPLERDRRPSSAPTAPCHQIDQGARQPGTYSFTWNAFDAEGTWHWNVQATDDQNRQSTADRTFSYDLTLTGLAVPSIVRRRLKVGFTLSRPASAVLSIAAPNGTLVATLPGGQPPRGRAVAHAGTASRRPARRRRAGAYIATVTETSSIGTASSHALASHSAARVCAVTSLHRQPRAARRLHPDDGRRRLPRGERADDALRRARSRRARSPGSIALFGHEFQSGFPAYVAVVVAGVAGNTLGAAGGWWIGVRGGHPLLERYGRYVARHAGAHRPRRALVRPLRGTSRCRSASRRRSCARSSPSRPGSSRSPFRRFIVLGARRHHRLLRPARRHRLGGRLELAAPCTTTSATSSSVVVVAARALAVALAGQATPVHYHEHVVPIPHVDVKAQYAPLVPELKAAFERTLESGRFIFGPEVEGFEREAAEHLGVAADDRRRQRHRRDRARPRRARDRRGRRGDLPGVHVLRDGRGDRPRRRDARSSPRSTRRR